MTSLSVNLNKIAVLRNSRGGNEPDVLAAARCVIDAGAHGVTVHPRPDLRHVRPDDVRALAALLRDRPHIEFNIEGNPFAPPDADYPGLIELVREARPRQCTLVPDGDGQLTSDHGFDLVRECARLAPVVAELRLLGVRVSVFVDAGSSAFDEALAIGIDRVEIYTGPFAQAFAGGRHASALAQCVATARAAQAVGIGVNAGHDLDQRNLGQFLDAVPGVMEVSIGHALIAESLYAGLDATVRSYLAIIAKAPDTSG